MNNKKSTMNFIASKKIDIILPFRGCYNLVRSCLESIIRKTLSNSYQIFLVDDGSTNSVFLESLKKKGFNGVRLENSVGFGAAVNIGLENTNSPYVIVIHSDCVVENIKWIAEMENVLLKHKNKKVSLVTATNTNPALNYPALMSCFQGKQDMILEQAAPFFCFMFERSIIKKIGKFKEYSLTGYENEEFAVRMRRHHLKQAVAFNAKVFHEGSKTLIELSSKNNEYVEKILNENKKRLIQDCSFLVS